MNMAVFSLFAGCGLRCRLWTEDAAFSFNPYAVIDYKEQEGINVPSVGKIQSTFSRDNRNSTLKAEYNLIFRRFYRKQA